MATKSPDAFLSYTHFDDQYHGGAIGRFSDRLSMAVRAITAKPFEILRDIDGIELGENWRERLNIVLGETRFFIPILTPNYFESKACRDELARFLEFERQSGRNDLILPIYYIDCAVLEDPKLRSDAPLAMEIDGRQRYDWRKLRNKPFGNSAVRTELERLARQIHRARLRPMSEMRAPQLTAEAARPEQTLTVSRTIVGMSANFGCSAIQALLLLSGQRPARTTTDGQVFTAPLAAAMKLLGQLASSARRPVRSSTARPMIAIPKSYCLSRSTRRRWRLTQFGSIQTYRWTIRFKSC
jgi:TIR domain